jgi:hypothetical protein
MTTGIFRSQIFHRWWLVQVAGGDSEDAAGTAGGGEARMIAEYEISAQDAATLTATREFADRFETAARGEGVLGVLQLC